MLKSGSNSDSSTGSGTEAALRASTTALSSSESCEYFKAPPYLLVSITLFISTTGAVVSALMSVISSTIGAKAGVYTGASNTLGEV